MDAPHVKICGVTGLEDALLATELGAWAVGMVFHAARRVAVRSRGGADRGELQRQTEIAGVFVNAPLEEVGRVADRARAHARPAPRRRGARVLRRGARRTGARVIQAAPVRGTFTSATSGASTPPSTCSTAMCRVCAAAPASASTGRSSLARRSRIPLIVSGGLDADNVAEAIEATRPFAVDVASGVESAPGVKDPDRLRAFIEAARAVDGVSGASHIASGPTAASTCPRR